MTSLPRPMPTPLSIPTVQRADLMLAVLAIAVGSLGAFAMQAPQPAGEVSGYYLGLAALVGAIFTGLVSLAKLFTDQTGVKTELTAVKGLLATVQGLLATSNKQVDILMDQVNRLAEENRKLTGHAVQMGEGNSAKLDDVIETQRKSDSNIQRMLNEKQQRVANRAAVTLEEDSTIVVFPPSAGHDEDKTPPIRERT